MCVINCFGKCSSGKFCGIFSDKYLFTKLVAAHANNHTQNVTNLKKIRTIKELLEIDVELLQRNSTFKTDLVADKKNNTKFLLFDLNIKFLNIFDQFLISIFNDKAKHLEFRTSKNNLDALKKIIELITEEYGPDENNQTVEDWNNSKYMSWWFKNENHEQTYDDYENTDELYYGFMIDGMKKRNVQLFILSYSNVESKFENKNWLQYGI